MELVDKLRQEASSGHVAYTEFILKLKNRSDCLFCFFEGKDDSKYYGIRIEPLLDTEYDSIVCGGKEHVIAVENLISSKKEYKKILKCYFTDQDYEEPVKINNIYCLPSYSIENQYANKNVLQKILKHEFSLNPDEDDFSKVIGLFEKLQIEFHEKTTFINAWLACQSDKRKQLGILTHLNIDNTIGSYFNTILSQDLKLILDLSSINDLSKIQTFFPLAPLITSKELEEKLKYFKEKEHELYFRGKFQLKFFVSFLDRLKSEICKKQPALFCKKHKCNLRFEFANSLTNLSIYANTPECLYTYLKRIIKNAA
mgnify:CR=1 FL=1|jgi:hypothetical protein